MTPLIYESDCAEPTNVQPQRRANQANTLTIWGCGSGRRSFGNGEHCSRWTLKVPFLSAFPAEATLMFSGECGSAGDDEEKQPWEWISPVLDLLVQMGRCHHICGGTAMLNRPWRPRLSRYIHLIEAEQRHTNWQESKLFAIAF
ncbi:hypothetical protein AV530_002250 [Patagioenas fasciata monilis]|uniref:Uncharacterized protein n=1 Tax=Patagioenas fasciata monilis TaxID=372326 RepID=A0A1V4K5V0_PATFA|nr:hypothetical protein AV530_002250 [Patagioenas fasciata monilis]